MTYQGRKMQFELKVKFGQAISKEMLYVPQYAKKCMLVKRLSRSCYRMDANQK